MKQSISTPSLIHPFHQSYSSDEEVKFVTFKDLSANQIEEIYHWRNHIKVRKWMYNSEPFSFETHCQYLKNVLQSVEKFYWLVIEKEKSIGVISLQKNAQSQWEWGFYLNPSCFGTGYAIHLIFYALDFFFEKQQLENLVGYVNCFNTDAILLHELFEISHQNHQRIGEGKDKKWYTYRKINAAAWREKEWTITKLKKQLINKKSALKKYKEQLLIEQNHLTAFGFPIK